MCLYTIRKLTLVRNHSIVSKKYLSQSIVSQALKTTEMELEKLLG